MKPSNIRNLRNAIGVAAATALLSITTSSLALAQGHGQQAAGSGATSTTASYGPQLRRSWPHVAGQMPVAMSVGSLYEHIRGLPLNDRLIGWGADFVDGRWVIMRPIFQATVPNNPTPSGQEIVYVETTAGIETESNSSLTVGLEYDSAVVDVAASVTTQQAESSSDFSASVSLMMRNNYENEVVDLLDPGLVWTKEANAIRSISNVAIRTALWQQYFGRFVIVGKSYRGEIGVSLSVSDYNSMSLDQLSGFVSGSYAPVGDANAAFDTFLATAASRGSLSFSLLSEGQDALAIQVPTIEDMKDGLKRVAFINALLAQLPGHRRTDSLLALPATAILNGPQFSVSWNSILIDQATTVAKTSLQSLRSAWNLNFPYSLRRFLEEKTDPSTMNSYASAIDAARLELLAATDELRTRYFTYFQGDNSANPVHQAALQAAIQSTEDAITDLNFAMEQIGPTNLGLALPAPVVLAASTWYVPGSGQQTFILDVELDNVAIFHDGLERDLGRRILSIKSSYQGWADLLSVFGKPNSAATWEGGLPPLGANAATVVLEVHRYDSGPSEGLHRIRCRIPLRVTNNPTYDKLRLKVVDMLGREDIVIHDLHSTVPIFNYGAWTWTN